jgi:hypothetical protein
VAENTFDILASLVERVKCKRGWTFRLVDEERVVYWAGSIALRLIITVPGFDANHPDNPLAVSHLFPVPTATYNEKTWRRWIFECCRGVENHELGEWFKVGEERPFAPLHGPGENPYMVHEYRDEVDRRTIQSGRIVEKLGE